MKLSVACQLDSLGQYLAVEESTFNLLWRRFPRSCQEQ